MDSYYLPAKKPPIIALLDNTFPLIAAQSHPDYEKWIKNNSLHLIAYEQEDSFTFCFFKCWRYSPLFINEYMSFGKNSYSEQMCRDYFVDIIIEKLTEGFYVILDLDEFYLPNKEAYNQFHFPHISMIFGYDKAKQTFSTIGYDDKNIYRQLDYLFSDIILAYLHVDKKTIQFIKHNEKEKFHFSMENFFLDITCFLYGTSIDYYFLNRISIDYTFWIHHNSKKTYGIYAQRRIISYLEGLIESAENGECKILDIRIFRVLLEHKEIMLESLKYLLSVYPIFHKEWVERYEKEVCSKAKSLFNWSLKYYLRKEKNILEKIKEGLIALNEKEGIILEGILESYKKEGNISVEDGN